MDRIIFLSAHRLLFTSGKGQIILALLGNISPLGPRFKSSSSYFSEQRKRNLPSKHNTIHIQNTTQFTFKTQHNSPSKHNTIHLQNTTQFTFKTQHNSPSKHNTIHLQNTTQFTFKTQFQLNRKELIFGKFKKP